MLMWEADYVPKYNDYIQSKKERERAELQSKFGRRF